LCDAHPPRHATIHAAVSAASLSRSAPLRRAKKAPQLPSADWRGADAQLMLARDPSDKMHGLENTSFSARKAPQVLPTIGQLKSHLDHKYISLSSTNITTRTGFEIMQNAPCPFLSDTFEKSIFEKSISASRIRQAKATISLSKL
jgi:hypothetical protein